MVPQVPPGLIPKCRAKKHSKNLWYGSKTNKTILESQKEKIHICHIEENEGRNHHCEQTLLNILMNEVLTRKVAHVLMVP